MKRRKATGAARLASILLVTCGLFQGCSSGQRSDERPEADATARSDSAAPAAAHDETTAEASPTNSSALELDVPDELAPVQEPGDDAASQSRTPAVPPATEAAEAKPAEPDRPAAAVSSLPSRSDSADSDSADSDSADSDSADSGLAARRPELFEGWGTPQLVLFVTGRQHGYIEPCGCAGLDYAKGGLSRRHTLAKQLTDRGWPIVAVDVGNQVRRFGRQPEIKFQMTTEGLKAIGYRAVALGPDDLRLSLGELIATAANTDEQRSPFVAANTILIDPSLMPQYQVVKAGGKKVGITSVLGAEAQAGIHSDEIQMQAAEEGLDQVWPELEKQQCDLYVLLAHATVEQSKQLARKYPGFDVVVTAGGASEPPYMPDSIEGSDTMLVEVGDKGMYVGVVGVFGDGDQRLRYQRVPLDSRFGDSEKMLDLMKAYQNQLQELGLQGLGIKPVPHPSGRTFVGSHVCADCHDEPYSVWEQTPHHEATQSLIEPSERVEIPRHYDPECLSCHVTGWNPQKYFPYSSGYLSLSETPRMVGNGCENCHGPGSAHVAAELGEVDADQNRLAELRSQMRLPLAEAEKKCLECHDLDNSPDFHLPGAFERYWQQIEH